MGLFTFGKKKAGQPGALPAGDDLSQVPVEPLFSPENSLPSLEPLPSLDEPEQFQGGVFPAQEEQEAKELPLQMPQQQPVQEAYVVPQQQMPEQQPLQQSQPVVQDAPDSQEDFSPIHPEQAQAFVPMKKPLVEPVVLPDALDESLKDLEGYVPALPSQKPPLRRIDGNVYVEKEEYEDMLVDVMLIEQDVKKASDHLARVIDGDAIILGKMKEWHDCLDEMHTHLIGVDSRVFDMGDKNG